MALVAIGQLHLVDQVPEVHVRGVDQRDVVVQVVGVVVRVLTEVTAAHGVGVLSLEAPQSTVVDGDGVSSVGAVGSRDHPGVTDDRATAPPATAVAAEAQTHDVGHLALVAYFHKNADCISFQQNCQNY